MIAISPASWPRPQRYRRRGGEVGGESGLLQVCRAKRKIRARPSAVLIHPPLVLTFFWRFPWRVP